VGKPRIAIVTMARGASDVEVLRITDGLTQAAAPGLPVYVTDHSGSPGVRGAVELLPNLDLAREASEMAPRIASSFRRARHNGAEVCVYSEPDKIPFFQSGLDRLVHLAEQHPESLVVAARNASAFATVPEGQRKLESMANEIGATFLGKRIDYFFGPFAIPGSAVERYLPLMPASIGWGWRTYLMARCILEGMPVVVLDGAFDAPEWNRGEDDAASRLYRLKQFVESVDGFRQALASPRI
jgi:hypothetical protein